MKKEGMNKIYVGFGILVLAVVLIFVFSSGGNSSANNNSGNTFSGKNSSASNDLDNMVASGKETVKEFTMTAQRYSFTPGNLKVNKGDTVILHITSTDVTHGFALPQFGVSQELPVGQEKTVKFVADKAGTYTFFCNVYCGPGHSGMKGTLTVQ